MMAGVGGNFTCVTCRVQYPDGDAQRVHYKSEWHRYNLKRKVASLPPVTESFFVAKSSKLSTAKTSSEAVPSILRCNICNKNFATDNSLQSHLESKKHKEAVAAKQRKGTSISDSGNEEIVVKIIKKKPTTEDRDKRTRNAKESQNKRAKLVALRSAKSKAQDDNDDEDGDNEEGDDEGWESLDEDDNKDNDDGADSGDDDDDIGDSEEAEAFPFGEGEPIPNTTCLFCSNPSSTVEDNLTHMSSTHSFFVPDLAYLIDAEGLLTYLGEKVGCGFICLWCNEKGKAFHSVEAAQTHMRDKGHTKILHEGDALLEYADFYDYRPSYPDYDAEKNNDTDMEVETGSQATSEDEVDVEELDGEGFLMVLPSGATVGHRSLLRYYKQSLNPRFHNAVVSKQRLAVQKLLAHYKALGWTGTTGEAAKVKAKDIQFAQKAFHKNRMRLGVKANKLQHHFREQVMF